MKNQNILLIFAIILIIATGAYNDFKTNGNLRESKKILENVKKKVEESSVIIEKQTVAIDELKQLNQKLSEKVTNVDSVNTILKKSIDINLVKANKTINDLKKTIDEIKPVIIH